MDGLQLRDEAAQDRVRAATEFLDPSKSIGSCVVVP
jgi:DNA replication licensing factor MCM3